jgi:hypothetical protein
MGLSTIICPVQQDLQERNIVWMGLSSHSPNFNKNVTVKLDMERFSMFMRLTIHSPNLNEECTTFNNKLINYNVITLKFMVQVNIIMIM